MNSPLRIELFGGLQLVRNETEVVSRFQTRKTAALLAYLAYHRDKVVSREVLTEILWPDSDPVSSRNSFRVALNSLRRQLEPPSVPPGAILFADRVSLQLNPAACTTDVGEFDESVRGEKSATEDGERVKSLVRAAEIYKGPLLVGWYDEWIDVEQNRLSEVYAGVLRRLTALLTKRGEYDRALEYAHRAVRADPLREETSRNLMRLHAAVGQPAEAIELYRRLEALLRSNLGTGPSAATRQLVKLIAAGQTEIVAPPSADTGLLPEGERASLAWSLNTNEPASRNASSAPGDRNALEMRQPESSSAVGSVPIQFTRFFGRESELADLRDLVRPGAGRLVTITGPGGTGKTRLSVELASRVRDDLYGGRAWVLPLSDVTDANRIPSALLGVMRLSPQVDVPIFEQLAEAIGPQPTLVVLDNLEQMVDGAHTVIRDLLERLTNVTVLTTSRQRLDIAGERDYALSPLPTPSSSLELPESISRFPSIALFVDRARNVRPDFQVTPRNAVAIAEVCRRLDGLPLALELAAASVRLLSPAQMADRLRSDEVSGGPSVDLLATERREFSPRHRSLRTVMDDSYELLPDDLCLLFARLSVFRGGWTLHAAEQICKEGFALDLLDLLNRRSLVVVRERESGMRFSFLETIRQYAEGKLTDAQKEPLKQAHSAYYSDFAIKASRRLNGTESDEWCDLVELEHSNLRAAIAWCALSDPDEGLRICAALWRYWYARGYAAEGLDQIEKALSSVRRRDDEPRDDLSELVFTASHGAGRLALSLGNTSLAASYFAAARESLDNAPLSDGIGIGSNATLRAMLMNDTAIAAESLGDAATAEQSYRELVRLHRAADDPWAEACALSALGAVLDSLGRNEDADTAFRESVRLRTRVGDWWGGIEARERLAEDAPRSRKSDLSARVPSVDHRIIAASFLQLGHIASERGDDAAAIPLLRDALSAYERAGDEPGAAIANERIAIVCLRQDNFDAARKAINDALLLRRPNVVAGGSALVDDGAGQFARMLLMKIDKRSIA